MNYLLVIGPLADKQSARLDHSTLQRLQKCLEELSLSPYDPRLSKPVTMSRNRRTSRVGNWRLIYYVDEPRRAVVIAAICPRDKAYDKV
jgi:mRNA interferase RelE/StbE